MFVMSSLRSLRLHCNNSHRLSIPAFVILQQPGVPLLKLFENASFSKFATRRCMTQALLEGTDVLAT